MKINKTKKIGRILFCFVIFLFWGQSDPLRSPEYRGASGDQDCQKKASWESLEDKPFKKARKQE